MRAPARNQNEETTALAPLPPAFAPTREALHRVATHVLARRRWELSGRFGLRAAPGGIAAPPAGPEHEAVRIAGTTLVRERTGDTASTATLELAGTTLRDAAAFAGVDLQRPFAAGHDTPGLGDLDQPLDLDRTSVEALWRWFAFGWSVLDRAVASLGAGAEPTVVQLWPEHFDAGVDAAAAPRGRVNLGASPGDAFRAEPYLYVGPWSADRPGDPDFWNAPFGAALSYDDLRESADAVAAGEAFLRRGVALVAGIPTA